MLKKLILLLIFIFCSIFGYNISYASTSAENYLNTGGERGDPLSDNYGGISNSSKDNEKNNEENDKKISNKKNFLDEAFESTNDYQIVKDIDNGKVQGWVKKTMTLMLKLTVIIGIAVFLYGGIRFLLSMGDDSKAKKTRDTLIVSAIGLIIAFGAWTILQLILSIGTTIQQ